jgi:hypothetical protein
MTQGGLSLPPLRNDQCRRPARITVTVHLIDRDVAHAAVTASSVLSSNCSEGSDARKFEFHKVIQLDPVIQLFLEKSCFRFSEIRAISPHPALSGGALRPIVTNVGGGMRWT